MFNKEHTKAIAEWFKNPSLECELRFGQFENKHFNTNVSAEIFFRVKGHLEKFFKYNILNIKETVFVDGTKERLISQESKPEIKEILKKKVLYKVDSLDYNFRLSVAEEQKSQVPSSVESEPILRNKKRYEFYDKLLRYDLTVVEVIFKDRKQMEYQIEMELIEPSQIVKSVDRTLESYLKVLGERTKFLFQIIQDTFTILSNKQRESILHGYKMLTKSSYFIGAQPETLTKDTYSKLTENEYSVTVKADGDRYFLLISQKHVFLIDNNLFHIKATRLVIDDEDYKEIENVLLDGELVKYDGGFHFYAFDALFFKSKDLRGDKDYMLQQRLDCVDKMILVLQKYQKDSIGYIFHGKQYYFNSIALGCKLIMESKHPFKVDGLIFTPLYEAYPMKKKWDKLLKWKDTKNTTIDFYSVKDKDTNIWKLYVQGPSDDEKQYKPESKTISKILFDVTKLCGSSQDKPSSFETEFDNTLIDSTTGEPFITETVIEYRFDKLTQRFIPIKTRWDKTHNETKHGNYYTVACDIWKYIQSPIRYDQLLKTFINSTKVYKKATQVEFFKNMRFFHNVIKKNSYKKYLYNANNVLELCSGRGGDMNKWFQSNIKNVTGYDINTDSVNECKRRYIEAKGKYSKKDTDYTFIVADLTKMYQTIDKTYKHIVSHFGFHYLYKDKNQFIKLVEYILSRLENNGYFIMTIVNNEYLEKKPVYLESKERQVVSFYKYKQDTRKLELYLSGNNYLSFNNEEYVLNKKFLIKLFDDFGLTLVEDISFEEYYKQQSEFVLDSYEKNISFMYSQLVFKKTRQVQTNSTQETRRFKKSDFSWGDDEKEIVLPSDIKMIKIPSLYNLLDIINQRKVMYNKYKFKDAVMSEDVFELLNYHSVFFIDHFEMIGSRMGGFFNKDFVWNKDKPLLVISKVYKKVEDICYDSYYLILYKNHIYTTIDPRMLFEFKLPKESCIRESVTEELKSNEKQSEQSVTEELKSNEKQSEQSVTEELKSNKKQSEQSVTEKSETVELKSNEKQSEQSVTEKSETVELKSNKEQSEESNEERDFYKLKVVELREMLKAKNLSTSGKKQVLIDRLIKMIKK